MATKKSSSSKPAAKTAKSKARAPKARGGAFRLDSLSVSLTVNDIAKSIVFYRDVLGFSVIQQWVMEGVVRGAELSLGGASIMIGQDDWKKGRNRKKGEALRFYFMTTQDLDVLAAMLKSRGLKLEQEPMTTEWGRHFAFSDPDGFHFTVAQEAKKKKKK